MENSSLNVEITSVIRRENSIAAMLNSVTCLYYHQIQLPINKSIYQYQ